MQIVRSIALAYNTLPRPHRILLGSLTVITLAVSIWRPTVFNPVSLPVTVSDSEGSLTQRHHPIDLIPDASEPLDQVTPNDEIPKDELDESVGDDPSGSYEYVVSSGDSLSSILSQYGVDNGEISTLVKQYNGLQDLKVGQTLSWTVNETGQLESLIWVMSRRETRIYELINGKFTETKEIQKGEWRNQVVTGSLNGSFVNSARAAGLTNSEIHAVTKALQWQMDFRKLRKGDQFAVLLSREFLGESTGQSQLLGVRLRSAGKDYYAFRSEDGRFYDREGSGLSKGFLRFPMTKQYRISSHFNPHRVNPVTRRVAAHNGVDFSMPVGTPVLAVGDGEVLIAKYSGAAGNYVAIRHGRQYTTRYMHLKKLLVKPGQKVKRGERIALSGNTGRSTGPHLHYEMWVNNKAVNPLTAKLPASEGLTGKERKAYIAQVKEMLPQLQFK